MPCHQLRSVDMSFKRESGLWISEEAHHLPHLPNGLELFKALDLSFCFGSSISLCDNLWLFCVQYARWDQEIVFFKNYLSYGSQGFKSERLGLRPTPLRSFLTAEQRKGLKKKKKTPVSILNFSKQTKAKQQTANIMLKNMGFLVRCCITMWK